MKKFTKLLGIVLIIALVLSMGTMAFAESQPTTYTDGTIPDPIVDTTGAPTNTLSGNGSFDVTIVKNETDTATHNYQAYQIFAGDLLVAADGTRTLSNITWGNGIAQSKLGDLATAINALRDSTATGYVALTANSTPQQFAAAMGELNDAHDSATAQALAAALGAALSSNVAGSGASGVTGLKAGYYLIKDEDASLANVENGVYTRYMLQVVADVTVYEKASVPSVEKKVADNNDTDTLQPALADITDAAWHDSADYDIGDAVPFKLTATTASTTSDYVKYHVTFQDKQCDGLDAPTSYTISVLGKTLTLTAGGNAVTATTDNGTKITAENAIPDNGYTFAIKVTFENSTANSKINAEANSQKIVVKYSAVLNEDAEIGAVGNENEVYLKYSNNPNSNDDNEEGKTPPDTVIVFTYKTYIDKVDKDGEDLNGADFTLYKQVLQNTPNAVKGSDITFDSNVEHDAIKTDKYYVEVGHKTGDATGSTFEFEGIDDGTYVLVETTVPAGYNAWKSETVTVQATHTDADDQNNPLALTSLTATAPFNTDNSAASGTVNRTKTGTKHDRDSGEVYAEIINQSGTVLPSTGGIGTTIFYVVGSIMVVAAGVLLITKKRMGRE